MREYQDLHKGTSWTLGVALVTVSCLLLSGCFSTLLGSAAGAAVGTVVGKAVTRADSPKNNYNSRLGDPYSSSRKNGEFASAGDDVQVVQATQQSRVVTVPKRQSANAGNAQPQMRIPDWLMYQLTDLNTRLHIQENKPNVPHVARSEGTQNGEQKSVESEY